MLIYLIDDCKSELLCWEQTFSLHAPDVRYRLCNTYEELNSALADELPDIVVIDYIMPFHAGTKVNEYIREFYPTVLRVICSGMDGPEYQLLATESGAAFVSKAVPFPSRLETILALAGGCNG